MLEKQVLDSRKPSEQLGLDAKSEDLVYFDMLRDRFLTNLKLYIDDLKAKNKRVCQLEASEAALRDQLIRLKIDSEHVGQERAATQKTFEKIIELKVSHVKLEGEPTDDKARLVQHQQKTLLRQEGTILSLENDKSLLENSLKGYLSAIKQLEKQAVDQSDSLRKKSDEVHELKARVEKGKESITFMWDRLEFQQRIDYILFSNVTQPPTLETVTALYREEVTALRRFFDLNASSDKHRKQEVEKERRKEWKLSRQMQMEFELAKLQNRVKVQSTVLDQTNKDYRDLRQYLELAQMLRRVVGIQASERLEYQRDIQSLQEGLNEVKKAYVEERAETESLRARVRESNAAVSEATRKQEESDLGDFQKAPMAGAFVRATNSLPPKSPTPVKASQASAKAQSDREDVMQAVRTGSDIDSGTVKNVLIENSKLEEQNLSLKQHISELNQRLDKLESGRGSAMSSNPRTGGGSRASKVVTPVQIRDMPLKKYKADILASNTF